MERFLADICGLELDAGKSHRGAAFATASRNSAWWWTCRGFVIATERHTEIHFDERGRLHNENGPAIIWPDGFAVYALHGTRVPCEWILHRDTIDPKLALTHENVEQRRVLRDMLGWKRVLENIEHSVIDTDSDPEVGELIECDLGDDDGLKARFLKMRCGTGREFVERVDPSCETAIAAQEWRWGLKAGQYALEERT